MCKKWIYLVSLVLVLSMAGNGLAGVSNLIPADGIIHEDTWINLAWEGTGASYDVYFGDNFENVKDGTADTFQGNQTTKFYVVGFPGFAFPDGLVPGTTYYWRIDEIQADGVTIHKGNVWSFSILAKTAINPEPADGAEFVDPNNVVLKWTPGFGSKLHTVYIGTSFDEVNNAAGGLPQAATTFSPGPFKAEKVYYWRVDEFDAFETFKGDIWSFTTVGAAGSPNPSNGAVDVSQTPILSWKPADTASAHQIYFGTDADAVNNATTASPEYKGSKTAGDETLDPGQLDWDTKHFWRVDAVYDADPGNPVKGLVWSFTTANFLVVDDMEGYNDIDEGEPESNRIYNAWVDGYDDPTNGSQVGHLDPPFYEETIVHSGNKSMPFYYDNAVGNSEATKTLTSTRDWTVKDVSTLTLYFCGNKTNAPEPMYISLNGGAPVYHENPNASQIPYWMVWNIDLQVFADQGVNPSNVNTISIGFGDKSNPQSGGSGTVYFDDIRLAITAPPIGRDLPFYEDFESVILGTSLEESAGTEEVWTDRPPVGWVVDESGVPGIGNLETDGMTEWAGWAFADKDFWINTDGQRRGEFTLGQGVVAVADCDEWDDAAHPDSAGAGWYKTFLSTPVIDISGARAGTVQLKFDSSWRPEFDSDYHQTGIITASFDGAEPVEVLLWESDPSSPNFKDDNSTNETITVDLENPPEATSVVLTFGMFDAGNDWWWAIDNIEVTGSPK